MEAIRASRGMLGEPNNLSSLMDNGVQRPFSMKFIESMLPYGIATPDYCAEWHYGQAGADVARGRPRRPWTEIRNRRLPQKAVGFPL
jgi:hypothetical protein